MASDAKKAKLETDSLKTLAPFKIVKVLEENSDAKKIVLHGQMAENGAQESPGILILEKMPFNPEKVQEILLSSTLSTEFKNDIYGKYECSVEPQLNTLKANLIFPATDKHIAKYTSSPPHIINETSALYETVTLPYIKNEKFTIDWVYNILDHKKETERIVYEDPDPETGFVLLPDFKWSCKQVEDLYLLVIIHNRKIKSIRDLNHRHLPLLRKIWKDSCKAIEERYGVHNSQLRVYFHYQPSYYHLHVHFTHLKYRAPGSNCEGAHLLTTVIDNIEKQSNYYARAVLPFAVKEASGLFKAYQKAGYDFGGNNDVKNGSGDAENMDRMLEFFKILGKAKHEPCGEHWDVTYGESAWRLAIMAMCVSPEFDRKRLMKIALSSAFTCVGKEPDQNAEWEEKLMEVREFLCSVLPLEKAAQLFELYTCHVNGRRGVKPDSIEARAYRKLLELEEAILLWEEQQKETAQDGKPSNIKSLFKLMQEVGFPGIEQIQLNGSDKQLKNLLAFILKISGLVRLKRTGWVRSGVRDPERVAGHMYRMGVMALLLDPDAHDKRILNGSAMVISVVHDMAECVVGDITPSDNVSAEDKHQREMKAMTDLVNLLPTSRMSLEFFNAFERYEEQESEDFQAHLTKDLDKFDMIMQAYEYEEKAKKGPFLQDFFDSTQGVFKTDQVKAWDAALRAKRKCLHDN